MSKKIVATMMAIAAAGSFVAMSGAAIAQVQTTQTTIGASGYLQIDNLTITDVSSSSAPTQIFAADLSYPTMAEDGTIMTTTTAPATCEAFATDNSTIGSAVTCPMPAIAPTLTTTTAPTSTASSVYYSPYTVDIDPATQLLLSDRTSAEFGDFMPGDTVNVYGYFNAADDSIDAEVVRDLSQPAVVTTTALAVATSSTAIAELQAYISQLASLITEIQNEISSGVITATTTVFTSIPPIPPAAY